MVSGCVVFFCPTLSHCNGSFMQGTSFTVPLMTVCVGYPLCCDYQLPWLDVELKLVPIYVAVLVAALLAQSKVAVIITGGVGKNGSTVAVSDTMACLYFIVVSL